MPRHNPFVKVAAIRAEEVLDDLAVALEELADAQAGAGEITGYLHQPRQP